MNFLIVGLGNPGAKYEQNRHNIGFLAADSVAGKLGASSWVRKFGGEMCDAHTGEDRVYFLKPHTFMNLSGQSVGAAAGFYKIPPERVIALADELDLLPGKLRVKQGGGNGGHNGIRSMDEYIGANYWRVRIGIGHPGDKNRVTDHVLSDFNATDWPIQQDMIAAITRHFPMLLKQDAAGFMNKVALDVKASVPQAPKAPGQ